MRSRWGTLYGSQSSVANIVVPATIHIQNSPEIRLFRIRPSNNRVYIRDHIHTYIHKWIRQCVFIYSTGSFYVFLLYFYENRPVRWRDGGFHRALASEPKTCVVRWCTTYIWVHIQYICTPLCIYLYSIHTAIMCCTKFYDSDSDGSNDEEIRCEQP